MKRPEIDFWTPYIHVQKRKTRSIDPPCDDGEDMRAKSLQDGTVKIAKEEGLTGVTSASEALPAADCF